MTAVPLAVPAPLTSRQNPEAAPVTDPSEFCRHTWVDRPSHGRMTTGAPGAVRLS